MESVLATLVPTAAVLALAQLRRADAEVRRALRLFALITLGWFAPVWLTGSAPVSFDFLTGVAPWAHLRPDGYLVRNPLLNDVVLQFIPWRDGMRDALAAGEAPFLLRGSAAGTPLWENLQVAPLYPFTWVALLFSPAGGALFLAVAKTLLALGGMYLFLRAVALSHTAGLFGAIAYAFGGFSITFLLFPHTNVTSLLPLFCHALVLVSRSESWRPVAWASALLGLMFFGGHPESIFHAAFVALPFAAALALGARRRIATGLRFLSAGLLALTLAAPLLLPFLAWLPHTQRFALIEADASFLSAPPFEAATFVPFVIPNYFGNPRVHNYRHDFNFNDMASQYAGLTTLILALCAVVLAPKRHAFWGILVFALIAVAFPPPPLARALSGVPLFDVSAKPQLRLAVLFALAVLGAHGLDAVRQSGRRSPALVALGVAALVAAIALASYPLFAQYGIRRLIFFTEVPALAGAAFLALAVARDRRHWMSGLPALLALDLFAVLGLYNPAVPPNLAYPETGAIRLMRAAAPPFRVAGIEDALAPNAGVMFGLEDVRPHDPLSFEPYVAFLRRGGLDTTGYFAKFGQPPPPILADYLGIRFLVVDPDAPGSAAYRGADATVFENRSALPRFFVPSAVTPSADPVSSFYAGGDARRVFVSGSRGRPAAPARVRLLRYGARSASLEVVADQPSFVASSEVALPGWTLTRDGGRWPIVPVNGVFIGFEAPAGRSVFTLAYTPRFIGHGALLAILALAIITGIGIAGPRAARSSRLPPPPPLR